MQKPKNKNKTAERLRQPKYQDKDTKRKRKNANEQSIKPNQEFERPDGKDKDTGVPTIKPNIIESFRNAQTYLHRTMVDVDRNIHKGIVCVVCDGQITDTDPVCYLNKEQIRKHEKRLSVQSYNGFFGGEMDPVLAKQYEVDDLK